MARGRRDGVKAGMWVNLSPLVSNLVIFKYLGLRKVMMVTIMNISLGGGLFVS